MMDSFTETQFPQARAGDSMRDHERALGVPAAPAYLLWCRKWGFSIAGQKTLAERQMELDWQYVRLPTWDLVRSLYPDPAKLLEEVCLGRMDPAGIEDPTCRTAAEGLKEAFRNCDDSLPARSAFSTFLSALTRPYYNELIGDTYAHAGKIMKALVRVFDARADWLRDPADWRPPKREDSMFVARDLIHFLFDEHNDVPCHLDSAWWMDGPQPRLWRDVFIQLGRGASPSECRLPAPLTRRGGHFFRRAPVTLLAQQALRWAQVKALGGGDELAMAVAGSRLSEETGYDAFWAQALRFLVSHPELPHYQVGPVIDFLRFRTASIAEGEGYSLKGRTVASVLRQVEDWHRELHRDIPPHLHDALRRSIAPHRPCRPFAPVAGGEIILQPDITGSPDIWVARQLMTASELAAEGRDLLHCVATFERACERGALSIWSLGRPADRRAGNRLTLTLMPDGRVSEARGLRNRLPEPHEIQFIEAFARAAGDLLGR